MQTKPRSRGTLLDRIILVITMSAFLFLAGYNVGLVSERDIPIPRDSTPVLDASGLTPVRFVVSHRDTLESGLVIEVIQDLIWHNCTVTVKYFGNELASATIDK